MRRLERHRRDPRGCRARGSSTGRSARVATRNPRHVRLPCCRSSGRSTRPRKGPLESWPGGLAPLCRRRNRDRGGSGGGTHPPRARRGGFRPRAHLPAQKSAPRPRGRQRGAGGEVAQLAAALPLSSRRRRGPPPHRPPGRRGAQRSSAAASCRSLEAARGSSPSPRAAGGRSCSGSRLEGSGWFGTAETRGQGVRPLLPRTSGLAPAGGVCVWRGLAGASGRHGGAETRHAQAEALLHLGVRCVPNSAGR